MKTFENYLKDIHASQAQMLLDDDLSDDFDTWVSELQIDEVIAFAEKWGETL